MTLATDHLVIPATERSPQIDFDYGGGRFLIRGESYPEDAARFFGPLQQSLNEFIKTDAATPIVFDVDLQYFNSSSAKALMNLFQSLERAAEGGRSVAVNWRFSEDDTTMREFGEDFAQDFNACVFNLCADGG